MDPATVADHAFDGVAAERFLIATHRHARKYFQDRAADVEAAFEALERAGADESYDVLTIFSQMTAHRGG